MSKYGLTEEGFITKDFDAIRLDRVKQAQAYFGKVNLEAPSVLSQIIDIPSYFEAYIWEKAEAVYNAMYPNTAEGYSLDGICALVGLARLSATYTTAICQITGINNTLIPVGSEIAIENTAYIFSINSDLTLSNEKCHSITLEIKSNIVVGSLVSVTIEYIIFSYETQEGDTPEDIASLLGEELADQELFSVVILENRIIITTNIITDIFSCYVSNFINVISVTNNAIFTSKTLGNIAAPSFSLNTINTPISGWYSISNIQSGTIGREKETDLELRNRLIISKTRGTGSLEAIRSRLLNLNGVTSVTIIENDTNGTVDGLPPKSFQALVLGGDNTDIAKEIWLAKPAGIQSHGNTEVQVTDSQNITHTIKFSRSTNLFIYVLVVLDVNDNYLESSTQVIKNLIVSKINAIGVGNNVISQSFFTSIYSVAGITEADIQIASSLDENLPPLPGDYSPYNIEMDNDKIAKSDLSKISITGI